jgi:hypothetical protein
MGFECMDLEAEGCEDMISQYREKAERRRRKKTEKQLLHGNDSESAELERV